MDQEYEYWTLNERDEIEIKIVVMVLLRWMNR